MAVFDKEAKDYDSWYNSKLGSFVDKVETTCVFKLFKLRKGKKVLDAGCGTGNFSIKLAKLGCDVTAVDLSNEMLNVARDKACREGLDIDFIHMDVHKMDFADNYFDGVLSVTAFEFFKRPQLAFDEILRVLKPKGYLLIGTINRESEWGKMYLSKEVREDSVFRYAELMTVKDLKSLNKDKLVNVRECLFVPPYAKQEEISLENEKKLFKDGERGGFICALWQN